MKTFDSLDKFKNEERFSQESQLSPEEQRFIWEITPLPEEHEQRLNGLKTNIASVNGSVDGDCKLQANFNENITKFQANSKLKEASWKTPAKEIAFYLEALFGHWDKKPNHWLYIAQHYTPKTIRSVRLQMIKTYQRGDVSIMIPGAYFTSIIKHKKKRKIFRDSNGGRKQEGESNND